jgi:hypothetical protein
MLPYFPFEDEFDPGMGMRLLKADEPFCHVEPACFRQQLALKQKLLAQVPGYYFLGGEATLAAQWDVVELIASDLARQFPQDVTWRSDQTRRTWKNTLAETSATFEWNAPSSLPLEPLDWIGRQVQEDLVLLSADATARFVGGQLCFANGWDIQDRAGKSFAEIHQRTPKATMASVHTGVRFLENLKPGRTFWRMSWNFKLSDQMDMTTRHKQAYKEEFARRAPTLSAEDVGSAVFIRIERQTFTRLPCSGMILFGIHTYNSQVAEEARDPRRARSILNVIRGAPRDVKDYKAITPIEQPLVGFLESRASA